jgi:hypothetical protein
MTMSFKSIIDRGKRHERKKERKGRPIREKKERKKQNASIFIQRISMHIIGREELSGFVADVKR